MPKVMALPASTAGQYFMMVTTATPVTIAATGICPGQNIVGKAFFHLDEL